MKPILMKNSMLLRYDLYRASQKEEAKVQTLRKEKEESKERVRFDILANLYRSLAVELRCRRWHFSLTSYEVLSAEEQIPTSTDR
jgi:hypothetical protein